MPTVTTVAYSGKVTAQLAGVTYRQLDYMCRTDLVVPTVADAAGSGSRRRFSFRDVVVVAAIAELRSCGATRSALAQVAATLQDEEDWSGLAFLTYDGQFSRLMPSRAITMVVVDLARLRDAVAERAALLEPSR